jgi:ABC-type tungstate transport system permease subunit
MKKPSLKGSALLGVAVMAAGAAASTAYGGPIRILGTSDITDSGLYAARIQNVYATSPYFVSGDTPLTYIASGSGQALTSAEQGFGDVVLVHSPSAEASFVSAGFSAEPLGRSLFYNNYFVAGPTGDPAGVAAKAHQTNTVAAFQDIAAVGATNSSVSFVSRNDASGTNVKEEQIWAQTTGVPLQPATFNPTGTPGLEQPVGSGTTFPSWYVVEPPAGQHQGQNLINTNNCGVAGSQFPSQHGCYTLVDNGTFDFEVAGGNSGGSTNQIPNLKAVVSKNTTGPGGTTELINPFHAYIVTAINPTAGSGGVYQTGITPNVTAATRFVNFLTGATGASGAGSTGLSGEVTFPMAFQDALSTYLPQAPASTGPIFKDAAPTVTNASPGQNQTINVVHGTTLHVSANLVYAPPPTPAVSGIPYSLQESTNGSATWTVIGSANSGTTGLITGSFSLPSSGDTAKVRLFTPTFDDTSVATRFSPNNDSLDFGSFHATS